MSLFCSLLSTTAQAPIEKPSINNTYAVVIGISKYQNPLIPPLQYAHTDAAMFAEYLYTKSGGNVPNENIKLLLNEEATIAAIYEALEWLTETCKNNDRAYIYFSGHGDVETKTIFNLGYLLAYNTPNNNYIRNAVKLEDINNYANTISAKTNSTVIIITDACKSGKLAGDRIQGRGLLITREQERKIKNNEIRIAACGPDELAVENKAWGGGRGVFSYYLLNGLTGGADTENNGKVTALELKNYLLQSFKNDPLLAQEGHKQTPILTGNPDLQLATVPKNSQPARTNSPAGGSFFAATTSRFGGMVNMPMKPLDYFMSVLNQGNFITLFNFTTYLNRPITDLPARFIDGVAPGLSDKGYDSLKTLITELKNNPETFRQFNNKMAVLMHTKGQELINAYLQGDIAELEKRSYYAYAKEEYDNIIAMYDLASKLVPKTNMVYNQLQVNRNYFAGLTKRLKIPTVKDATKLVDSAIALQRIAMQLEPYAAYIHNEMANLLMLRKQYDSADFHFEMAVSLAPTWAIPWANRIALYNAKGLPQKAKEAALEANALQPGLYYTLIHEGKIWENEKNWLAALGAYQKSITQNTRHFAAFERLGKVSIQLGDYRLADSLLLEANSRKKGLFINADDDMPTMMFSGRVELPIEQKVTCKYAMTHDKDALFFLIHGVKALQEQLLQEAEAQLKKAVAIQADFPTAHHYLGVVYYLQQNWPQAAHFLTLATKDYSNKNNTISWLKDYAKNQHITDEGCLNDLAFIAYDEREDHYLLGDIYDKWGYWSEAAEAYRNAIIKDSTVYFFNAYKKLFDVLKKSNNYQQAEQVLFNASMALKQVPNQMYPAQNTRFQTLINDKTIKHMLYQFYSELAEKYPEKPHWHLKAGSALYNIIKTNPYDALKYTNQDNSEVSTQIRLALMEWRNPRYLTEKIQVDPPIAQPIKQAIIHLEEAKRLNIDDDEYIPKILMLAELYSWSGAEEKAAALYKEAISIEPNNASISIRYINHAQSFYNYTDALVQLDTLYKAGKLKLEHLNTLADYYMQSGMYEAALQILKSSDYAILHSEKSIDLSLGKLYSLWNKPTEALRYFTKVYQQDESSAPIAYAIARSFAGTGKYKKATQWIDKALRKGFAYYEVIKQDQAIAALRTTNEWRKLSKKYSIK